MFSWRFRKSLPPQRSPDPRIEADATPDSSSPPLTVNPPRYSDLPQLERAPSSSQSTEESSGPSNLRIWDDSSSDFDAQSLTSYSAPTYVTTESRRHTTTGVFSESTTTLSNPPRYSLSQLSSVDLVEGADGPKEFTFHITSGFKPKPWATLRLYNSQEPGSGPSKARHPRFSNLHNIFGNVELNISKAEAIKSIQLVLKGTMITTAFTDTGFLTFLEHTYPLWDRKFGDPRELAQNTFLGSTARGQKYDGKLEGNWLFPFSIPFPTHVDLSNLHAVYPSAEDGPLRLIPHQVGQGTSNSTGIVPFHTDGSTLSPVYERPADQNSVVTLTPTPFDVDVTPLCRRSSTQKLPVDDSNQDNEPVRATNPQFSTLSQSPLAPSSPILSPYPPLSPSTQNTVPSHKISALEPPLSSKSQPQSSSETRPTFADILASSPPSLCGGERLPQTFLERKVGASIKYELELVITHGRFSSESRTQTQIAYVPISIPPPRQPDEQESHPSEKITPSPQTPSIDPHSWHRAISTSIWGTWLQNEDLRVDYTLYLAKPLSYARGGAVPCYLEIGCSNPSALNIFADPRSPRIRLARSIRFLQSQVDTTNGIAEIQAIHHTTIAYGPSGAVRLPTRVGKTPSDLLEARKKDACASSGAKTTKSRSTSVSEVTPFKAGLGDPDLWYDGPGEVLGESDEASVDVIVNARWSLLEKSATDVSSRRLVGEIQLPKTLQPTCIFPLFNVLYRVELVAPTSKAFDPRAPRPPPTAKTKAMSSEGRLERDKGDYEMGGHIYAAQPVNIVTDPRADELPFPRYARRESGGV